MILLNTFSSFVESVFFNHQHVILIADGDYMLKTDIELTKNTLYIKIEGIVNNQNLNKLKKKIYSIIKDYDVYDIVIDVKGGSSIDNNAFRNFINQYDVKEGKALVIVSRNN